MKASPRSSSRSRSNYMAASSVNTCGLSGVPLLPVCHCPFGGRVTPQLNEMQFLAWRMISSRLHQWHEKDGFKGQQMDQLVEVKTRTNMDDHLIKNWYLHHGYVLCPALLSGLPLLAAILIWRQLTKELRTVQHVPCKGSYTWKA